jgi:hypothetical protein
MVGMDMFKLRSGFIDQDDLTSLPRSQSIAFAVRTDTDGACEHLAGLDAKASQAFFRIAS